MNTNTSRSNWILSTSINFGCQPLTLVKMGTASAMSITEVREKLKGQFSTIPVTEHNDKWESLWKEDFLPWDKGQPSPALIDALRTKLHLIGGPMTMGDTRRKALVPGCGKGYDVMLLAAHGFDAYGLEISQTAIESAEACQREKFDDYVRQGSFHGPGTCEFVLGDFFKDNWREKIGMQDRGFDLIYDYTFLCALSPDLRPAWAERQSCLLSPVTGSRLICLEYPTYKEPKTGGPPHGLPSDVYLAHLSRPGENIEYNAEGYPEKSTFPLGADGKLGKGHLKRLDHWKPERTHPIGQGTDWMSIWGC